MIWDIHCHLLGVPGETPHERMTQLVAFADRMGVERMCISMGMAWAYDPSPDDLKKQNDEVLQALEHYHDRAFGLVYLNPKHVEASLAELERCVAKGPMVGVKLWVAARCDTPEIDPLIRRCAELQAPIMQHTWYKTTGNLPGESTSADLAALARRHPQAQFICGHSGGTWELGLRAIRDVKNIAAEIGGSDPTSGFVEMAVRELGPSRVLFGSDIAGRSYASQLSKVLGTDLPEMTRRWILKDNLKRLLDPILRTKGIKM